MIRVAAVQMCSTSDWAENVAAARSMMRQAVLDGAQLIFLPEHFSYLTNPGGYVQAAESPEDGRSLRFLQDFAAEMGVDLIGGSVPISAGSEQVTNTCFAIGSDGSVLARYDKMHLFDVDLDADLRLRESDEVVAGSEIVSVVAAGLHIGLSICYDLRFPELYRTLVGCGANVLSIPSNFTVPTGRVHWETLLRARAIENLCYVVAPAQCGSRAAGLPSYGHSMIVDPWGRVLAEAGDAPDVLIADVDLDFLAEVRRKLPSLTNRML